MTRRVTAEMPWLCIEKLRNSGLIGAFFALIRNISFRLALDPESNRGSLVTAVALARTLPKPLVIEPPRIVLVGGAFVCREYLQKMAHIHRKQLRP
jgi:hypothetical protein